MAAGNAALSSIASPSTTVSAGLAPRAPAVGDSSAAAPLVSVRGTTDNAGGDGGGGGEGSPTATTFAGWGAVWRTGGRGGPPGSNTPGASGRSKLSSSSNSDS